MPKSFLIKKRPEKSTKNAFYEAKPRGRQLDLHGENNNDSVQTQGNSFETQSTYPAEVTAFNVEPRVQPSLNKDEKLLMIHEDKCRDNGRKEAMENNKRSTYLPQNSHPMKKHKCNECQRCFTTVASLCKHQHHRKEFTCKYCDKTYVSLGALKMHIRTHTLPCKCKVCGKAFSRPWLLQGHIRTHTGEKPYQCLKCQRAFADRSNLRAHLQTHSAVKKYCCSSCSRSFSRMSLLHKHQYTCGGE